MADTILDKLKNAYTSGKLDKAMATIGKATGSAIAAGRESGVGNAIITGGNFLGDIVGEVPILGKFGEGATKLAAETLGGVVNAAFDNKIDEQAVAGIRGEAEQLNNKQFDASNTADLLTNANFDMLGVVNKNDIGKEGWFSNKVTNLAKELTTGNMYANNNATIKYMDSVDKVDYNNDFAALKNQTAFGGPLMMRYSGPMSPFGKRFDTGGNIYIKPSKRGTFTAAAKEHGKSVQAFASQVLANKNNYSPSMVKKAVFARNSAKWHATGGPLYTQGGVWSDGLTYINEGGTHEENPYDGVQVGVDPNGIPNTVEEGEVIFNDYVFSNRLNLDEKQKNYFKLGGKMKYSYADAAKKLTKEFEETPNDPISKNGRNAILQDLMMFQEEKRAKQQERKLARQFDKMSTEEKMGLMEMANQYAQQQNQGMQQPQEELQGIPYAKGGRLVNKFSGEEPFTPIIVNDKEHSYSAYGTNSPASNPTIQEGWNSFKDDSGNPLFNEDTKTYDSRYRSPGFLNFVESQWKAKGEPWWTSKNAPDYFRNNKTAPSLQQLLYGEGENEPLMFDGIRGDAHTFGQYMFNKWQESLSKNQSPSKSDSPFGIYANLESSNPKIEDVFPNIATPKGPEIPLRPGGPETPTKPKQKDIPTYDTSEMYSPLLGHAGTVFNTLFSKPDYSTANDLYSKAIKLGNINRVTAAPVGQHLKYDPTDVNRMISQLNANTAATRRGAIEMSLGNRAQAMRQLTGINNTYLSGLADTYAKSALENRGQLERVFSFNRDTDKFDSENALRAAMANQSAQTQANVAAFSGIEKAIAERNRIDAERSATLSAGLTGYFQTLHDIGKQKFIMNSINKNPGYRYYYDRDGGTNYKGQNE